MRIRVLLFGPLADAAGLQETDLEVSDGARVTDVAAALGDARPGVSVKLDGVAYDGPLEAGEALRNHPDLGPCFVRTLFRYTVGREAVPSEWPLLDYLGERFADGGFVADDLVREIVLSDGFLTTSGAREVEEEVEATE